MKPASLDYEIDDTPRTRARRALAAAFAASEVRIDAAQREARICLGRASGCEVWLTIPIRIEHVRPQISDSDERAAIIEEGRR